MNIIFLCSMRQAPSAMPLLHGLLTAAMIDLHLHDGYHLDGTTAVDNVLAAHGIEVTGAMSTNADQGWRAMLAMASYIDIDSVVCFDKTCASLGLEGMGYFTPEYMRLPDKLRLTNVVRVPSSLDPWWAWDDHASSAAVSLKPMLVRAPVSAPKPHLAWPSTNWN